jgi:hypothetical protein
MGARNLRLPTLLAAALAAMTVALPQAEAFINDVAPSPSKARIAGVGPAAVTVNWNVERVSIDLPNPGTVSSSKVQIFIDGIAVGSLSRSVSQSTKGEAPTEVLRLREVVQIPQAMVYRAVKEGATLTLRRLFTDSADNSNEDGQFEVTPTGEGSVALSIQRLELTFDDHTRSRVLSKGSELRVVADINTSLRHADAAVLRDAEGAAGTSRRTARDPADRAAPRGAADRGDPLLLERPGRRRCLPAVFLRRAGRPGGAAGPGPRHPGDGGADDRQDGARGRAGRGRDLRARRAHLGKPGGLYLGPVTRRQALPLDGHRN